MFFNMVLPVPSDKIERSPIEMVENVLVRVAVSKIIRPERRAPRRVVSGTTISSTSSSVTPASVVVVDVVVVVVVVVSRISQPPLSKQLFKIG